MTVQPTEQTNQARTGGMWGGRFESGPAELFRAVNDSLAFDWRLVRQDIKGSRAWARGLGRAGVLTTDEVARLDAALVEVAEQANALRGPPLESGAEDVHSWVEASLIEAVGDLGRKLHTGRSRNDQVATDLRLWCAEEIDSRCAEIAAVCVALCDLAEAHAETSFPAYTHLQRAQPIVFGHWALAYASMLLRDIDRFDDARRRCTVCPLGSAALAGTTFAVDREAIARDLGFAGVSGNSLDAVSDRDFVVEAVAASALCAVHMSRLAEDLIIYGSTEFGLVRFDEAVTSGSSLMPQKKNPDALELIRGKAGRITAQHVSLLMSIKGLPLAYNKDLQEDKLPLYTAMEELSMVLRLAELQLRCTTPDVEAAGRAARTGYQNATELADYLVSKGVPFRTAHDASGRLVRAAMEQGTELEGLSLERMRQTVPELAASIGPDVFGWLSVEAALARRDISGGTAPPRVREAVAAVRSAIADRG